MPNLKYQLITEEDGTANLTVFQVGDPEPHPVDSTHPQWDDILKGVLADDASVLDIVNPYKAIGRRMLSERVIYDSGRLFFDGDPLTDGLVEHISRMLVAGDDFAPFVALLENIQSNPSANSRQQLSKYIDAHRVTITQDGILVLFKYVYRVGSTSDQGTDSTKQYRSGHSGPAIVNGQHVNGYVGQSDGDVVEMPRSTVVDNPHEACSHGLHCGSWHYVSGNGNTILEIRVNPRDVVSVPYNDPKLRVCRYKIVGPVTQDYDIPVLYDTLVKPMVVQPTPDEAPDEAAVASDEAGLVAAVNAVPKDPPPNPFESDEPVKPVKHPSSTAFATMQARAKARRKGFVRYATQVGKWTLLPDCTGERRTHWSV